MPLRLTGPSARTTAYWIATILVALAFLSGGAAYLVQSDIPVEGMTALGYPTYFVGLLGAWKVLGSLAIVAPRLPVVKEWAYSGIAFDLTGAAVSHAVVGDPAHKAAVPLLLLGIAAASWALRPASRRIDAASVFTLHGWRLTSRAGTVRY